MTIRNKIHNRILYYNCPLSFFQKINFYDLVHTLLDLKQLLLRIPLKFTYGVIIFTLINIGTQELRWSNCLIASYKFDQYMAFQWPLWPLKLNWLLFPLNQLKMIQTRGKNNKKIKFLNHGFWFYLKKNYDLFYTFWWSVMLKKSTGMQKIYIGVANHQSDFLDTFGPLGSLCCGTFTLHTVNIYRVLTGIVLVIYL